MMRTIKILLLAIMTAMSVNNINAKVVGDDVVAELVGQMTFDDASIDGKLLQRGASQVASLWQETDGSAEDFVQFVKENYATSPEARRELFDKLSKIYEVLLGTQNQVAIELSLPTILAGPEPTNIDYIMSAFNPYSHLWNDLYENKVAFMTILNFPNYTLAQKNEMGGCDATGGKSDCRESPLLSLLLFQFFLIMLVCLFFVILCVNGREVHCWLDITIL